MHPSVLSDGAVFFRQLQVWDVVISNKDIINSVFCYSWFQFAHVPYLLWQYLKKKDAGLYYKLYFGIFGRAMNIPGKGGRKVSVFAYKLANKVMGFN